MAVSCVPAGKGDETACAPLAGERGVIEALYLHVPFCVSRCAYCGFYSQATCANDARIAEYVECLRVLVARFGSAGMLRHVKTAYIGGGTPTLAGERLVGLAREVCLQCPELVEFTSEANPDSLSESLALGLRRAGITRVSLGVQSLSDAELRGLGRAHTSHQALEAARVVKAAGFDLSCDLMCGIPGQTPASWRTSLAGVLAAGADHVSCYPLSIEEGTPFDDAVLAGAMQLPDADLQADMMQAAAQLLRSRGLERYEVASYAYPGFECRHNIAYWTGVPYLGIGHSAVSMAQDDLRRVRMQDGTVLEELNRAQMAAEDLMLGMRMSRGVSCRLVEQLADVLPEAPAAFDGLIARGLVERKDGRFVPTETGWLYGNELYGELLGLAP